MVCAVCGGSGQESGSPLFMLIGFNPHFLLQVRIPQIPKIPILTDLRLKRGGSDQRNRCSCSQKRQQEIWKILEHLTLQGKPDAL